MTQATQYQTIIDALKSIGYDFRVNDLDDMLEYSVSNGGWTPVSKFTRSEIRTDMRELGYGIRGKKKPGLSAVEDAILKRANANRYNPILDYFDSLDVASYEPSPDGPYRIPLLAKLFQNPDGMFGVWLFKWMVGAIAKIKEGGRNPMLILVGPQKAGKSFFCQWICPVDEHFLRDSINPDDKDSHLRLTDHVVWEVEELGATTRKADVESLKAFVTRDQVKKRPAYGEQIVSKQALCSFIGTVNHDGAGFLNDFTGTTRFLACQVHKIDFVYSQMTAIDDLWVEAMWYYRNVPKSWQLSPEQEATQARINAAFEVPSALEEVIDDWFEITCSDDDFMTTHDIKTVLVGNYRIGNEQMFNRDLARVLTKLGCTRGRAAYDSDQPHRRGWKGLKKGFRTVKLN